VRCRVVSKGTKPGVRRTTRAAPGGGRILFLQRSYKNDLSPDSLRSRGQVVCRERRYRVSGATQERGAELTEPSL